MSLISHVTAHRRLRQHMRAVKMTTWVEPLRNREDLSLNPQ